MEINNEITNSSSKSRIMGASYNRIMRCKCNDIIPQARLDLGYTSCVRCSNTEPYGCISLTYHKTGNTIQILPKAQAQRIRKLTERRGYGTMLRNI